jgi:hypothetical protein
MLQNTTAAHLYLQEAEQLLVARLYWRDVPPLYPPTQTCSSTTVYFGNLVVVCSTARLGTEQIGQLACCVVLLITCCELHNQYIDLSF